MKAPTRIPIRVAIADGRTALVVGEQWLWLTAEVALVLGAKLAAAQAFIHSGDVEATVDAEADDHVSD